MSAPFVDFAHLAPLAALGASFAGSLHCAGMCGPLSLAAAPSSRAQFAYHGGRLAAYATLGALSGAAGHALLGDAAPVWLSLAAAATVGVVLVLQGLAHWPGLRWRVPFAGGGGATPRLAGKLLFRVLSRGASSSCAQGAAGAGGAASGAPQTWLALQAGMATGLLPCGWLYAFVAAAATAQSAARGALLMAAFWLGTVPALTAGTWAARKWLGPVARRFPRVAAMLLIVAGLSAVGAKLSAATGGFKHAPTAAHSCHDMGDEQGNTSDDAEVTIDHATPGPPK